MRNFSKIGATALALALSITMVAPVKVNAMIDTDFKGTATEDGTLDTTKDYTVTETRKETGKTYSYSQTNGVSTYDYQARREALNYFAGIPSKLTVGIDCYEEIDFELNYGETLDSVKIIKGKKNITLKKVGESSYTDYPEYDKTTKTYYFENLDGTKAYTTLTDGNYTEDAYYALQKTQYKYTYRLFGKAIGSAKIQYKVKDEAGKVTKKTITVTVSTDDSPFKTITYAGKNLLYDYSKDAKNNKYIYAGSKNKHGLGYTTKKSGKFKVNMNKDYKLVNIWVEKDNPWVSEVDKDSTFDTDYGISSATELVKQKAGVDLNGDGDYFDTIDGMSEGSKRTANFTKMKNGGKLALSTVPGEKEDYLYTFQSKTSKYNTKGVQKYESNFATTKIHIIYQEKNTKRYGAATYYINLRLNK